MSPARDHRASAESWPPLMRTPKVTWPRVTVDSSSPQVRWVDRAACHGRWAEFDASPADETRAELHARVAAARRVCDRCPVAVQCAEFARTASPPVTGILAGRYYPPNTSRRERSTTP